MNTLAARYDQQAELRAKQVENRTLDVENRTAQVENRTLDVENRTAQVENRTLDVENRTQHRVENRIAQLENRAAQAEARATEAQIVIQGLLLSTSWRITAPLRHITVGLRRFNAAIREGRLISGLKKRINSLEYIFRQPAAPKEQKQINLNNLSNLSPRAARIYADLQKAIEARKK